jgi:hypothetical protein
MFENNTVNPEPNQDAVMEGTIPNPDGARDDNASKGAQGKPQSTPMDKLISDIAFDVSCAIRSKQDASEVKKDVESILSTIMSINALEPYSVGVTVDGVLYRFDEYETTEAIANLVVAARVCALDSMTAVDFSDRERYKVSKKALTPGAFMLAQRRVCSALRVNGNFKSLTRSEFSSLGAEVPFAVMGNKVGDANQNHIVFLKAKFDDEARLPIREWCRRVAREMFRN